MFRGLSTVSLDSKSRLSIPAKYRCALENLVVVPNPIRDEPCLLLYPLTQWEAVEQDIVNKPNTPAIRNLKRFFLGQAVEYALDGNGRVLLTVPLREFARLDKKMILVGQGNKFELWDDATWTALNTRFFAAGSDDDLLAELETLQF